MWLIDLPVLALALAVFLTLTFYQIRLPGLHTDEALEVLPAVQLVRGQPVECFKDVCIDLFGLRLPVVIYEYIATVNTYMAIPFFAVLGISVPALRAMPILQSAVAMVFLYLLARELYNRRVALIAVSLIAVSPSFVFWSRQGVFVTSVTIPISLIGTWAWLRWWRNARSRYLYLGAFFFGLGVSAKFLFGWFLAGSGAAFVLLNLDCVVECARRRSLAPLGLSVRWRDVVVAGSLFVVGLLPLIIFNLRTMSTINYIRANVLGTSYYDVDNTNIVDNLGVRIKEFRSVLNGDTFWYLSIHPYASWRYTSVFLLAIGVAGFSVFGSRRQTLRDGRPVWITVAVTVLSSYAVLSALPLRTSPWFWVTLAIGLAASVLVGLFCLRGRSWAAWAAQIGTGLGAALLFAVYVYLAWKLTRWQFSSRIYAAGVVSLVLAPLLRARESARKVLFPVLLVAGMMGLSVFTPTALWHTHLAILTPWPYLIIAAVADLVARHSGLDRLHAGRVQLLKRQIGAAGCSLGLVGVLLLGGMLIHDDLEVDSAYHEELGLIGGKSDHTFASYRLAAYIQEHRLDHVVAMDFGIQDVVQFLTAGEVNPPEIFGYEDRQAPDPAFAIRVREQLERPDAAYVFHAQPHFQNRWESFQAIVVEEGKQVVEEAVIYDWSARPIYWVVRVTS